MKTLKKSLLLLLATLTLAVLFCFGASAATVPESGSLGDNVTYTYDSSTKEVVISGEGMMNDFSYSGSPFYNSNIKSVIIEEGVTSIAEYVFYGCTSLSSVTIPDSVGSIGYYAFKGCTSLASIEIPDSVTSIGSEAFFGCASLANITIPDSVTRIGYEAFSGCTSLANITIPDSVTSIGSEAFFGCTSLANITVDANNKYFSSDSNGVLFNKDKSELIKHPEKNTINSYTIPDSVTLIKSYAFSGCTSLVNITIPDSVTSIGYEAFSGCTSLANITIPDSVTSIGSYAFSGCTSLESITIPDNVTSIYRYTFSGCTSLANIEIPDSVTSIGDCAFSGCTSLTEIKLPESLTSVGDRVFSGAGTTSLKIPKGLEDYPGNEGFLNGAAVKTVTFEEGTDIISAYALYNAKSVAEVRIPDSVTSIDRYAFWKCSSLRNITIPDSVTNIGEHAFTECANLASIEIPDSVMSVGSGAFSGCTSLSNIKISNNVKIIDDYLFSRCTSLANITIPDSVISIGEFVFTGCDSLESIKIPDSITSIGSDAFHDCTGLKSITIPNSVTSIGNDAFAGCKKLTNIVIPDSVTSIGNDAFSACTSLTSVVIGNGITRIKGYTFQNCKSLTKVTIGDGVTSIGNFAFYGCSALSNIVIPDGVTSIDFCAFYGCGSLTSITIPDSVTTIGDDAFYNCKNLTIKCSPGSYAEAYAKEENINIVYYGYLSNGACWELKNHNLSISGEQTYIPGFSPGQAPWIKFSDDIATVHIEMENLKKIGQYAFYGLDPLSVNLSDTENTLHIGKYAFFGLSEHLIMTYGGTSEKWKANTVDYGNDPLKTARITCIGDGVKIEPVHVNNKADGLNFDNFVDEHVEIAENGLTYEALKGIGFDHNAEIDKTALGALGLWEVLGDIGNVITFNFKDLVFKANYFDIYLSELILLLNNEEKTSSFEWKVGSTYNKYYKKTMDFLKTSKDWDKDYEAEISDMLKGNEYELSEGAENLLETVFNDLYKNNKKGFTAVFEGLDTASGVLDNISDAADIANMFINSYNTYIVSKAFYEVNSEFFDVLTDAAVYLYYTSRGVYGESLLKAINKAKRNQIGSFESIYNTMFTFTGEAVSFAYDKVLKGTIQSLVYPAVADILGCTTVGGGGVAAATLSYKATYEILDAALKLGKKNEAYKTMNAVAPIEGSLRSMVSTYRSNLLKNKTENNAKKFDMAYNILRQTNIYLYDTAYKYGSYVDNRSEMNLATWYKNKWNSCKCHYGYYGSSYNFFSAHCPVDIYIYDANGLLVTAVVNEQVTEYSDDIMISVFNGEKTFTYPTDKDYSVKIIAREEGAMDYSAGVITDTETELEVKSFNIPLSENQEFTVNMPTAEEQATADDYKLNTNDTVVDLDYRSEESCDEHFFGEWSVSESETEERKCSVCGFTEYKTECNHSQYEEIVAYSVVPTCQSGGHTVYVCSGCGVQVRDGEDVSAVECDYAEIIFNSCTKEPYTKNTCIYCDDTYYEGITLEELNASDHDYSSVVTAPTCTETGYTTYTCSECGHSYVGDEVSSKGHSYNKAVTKPTCTQEGYTTYTCSACGDSYVSDKVSSNGHSYKSVVTKPTCTNGGYTTFTCSVCGNTYTGNKTTALGHSYAVQTINNGCLEESVVIYTCKCGDTYDEIIPATGHEFEDSVCKNCGYDKSDDCSCNCHKSGFMGFIWKILKIFYKLFKTNAVCECGVKHW